jgi:SagB-type dehydrogenase family enzyme
MLNPIPRAVEEPYTEWQYDIVDSEYLPLPDQLPACTFFEILESRKSHREFGPISQIKLSTLLWFIAKTHLTQPSGKPRWQHRFAPSAGGKHPIDLIVSNWPTCSKTLYKYDTFAHALCSLRAVDKAAHQYLISSASEALGTAPGVVLWHAAQFARTESKYEFAESLVWRDAGVLIALTTLVCEALGLACCPLGITGEPHLSATLGSGDRVQGVGGCVIGTRL